MKYSIDLLSTLSFLKKSSEMPNVSGKCRYMFTCQFTESQYSSIQWNINKVISAYKIGKNILNLTEIFWPKFEHQSIFLIISNNFNDSFFVGIEQLNSLQSNELCKAI